MSRDPVFGAVLAAALCLPQTCAAAVNDIGANGFSVTETVHIVAPPAKVYGELVVPANWWSPVHTFSRDAANLTLDPVAGGCWCEKLADGGSVRHLTVYAVMPGHALVLRGPLGPMQGLGVDGGLTITLKAAGDGTDLTATYNVGGYMKDGFANMAPAVDRVLGEQFTRLKMRVETGAPDKKP